MWMGVGLASTFPLSVDLGMVASAADAWAY